MEPFFDRLAIRAATVDELLSDEFQTLSGQQGDADRAAKRLASWCRACASGDWSLFGRRLARDNLTTDQVLARFATVRRTATSPPGWVEDAIWIDSALQPRTEYAPRDRSPSGGQYPFEHIFAALVAEADARLWAGVEPSAAEHFSDSAQACLRQLLIERLCRLAAPVLYERFAEAQRADSTRTEAGATNHYQRFVAQMQSGGLRNLFEEKPVLLRLIATLTRQWLDTSHELVTRLHADVRAIRINILRSPAERTVAQIEGGLSDPHNGGRTVHMLEFDDGSRVVYKPKDLRIDVALHGLVGRMNRAGAPVELRSPRTIACPGYGWTEYVEHAGCADIQHFTDFFRRAGGWLALLHCFAGADMHHENMIAAGEYPVPIDLETLLQAAAEDNTAQAVEAAKRIVANSVMAVGLLPSYGRSVDNEVFMVGGMAAEATSATTLAWKNVNTDTMQPVTVQHASASTPNLPHVDGCYARLGDHVDDLISGFEDYAAFLVSYVGSAQGGTLFNDFAGLPVRKVIRPTQFYHMLVHRLTDHRRMDDGIEWSVQADFIARLSDWDNDDDSSWELQTAERAAVLALNVPFFVMASDGSQICTHSGSCTPTRATPGLQRARTRTQRLNDDEIAWQVEVMRQNLDGVTGSTEVPAFAAEPTPLTAADAVVARTPGMFLTEADWAAEEISRQAIHGESTAAWIGLSRVGGSEVFQLSVLGPDLYNGACGIGVFLAAHATVAQRRSSADLALAAVSPVRNDLKSRNAARLVRSTGIGGATGLGSMVYGLTVIAKLLDDDELLAEAHRAAGLFTDDLIGADKHLDLIGGSAGAILGLLRLYRDTAADDVLQRAIACGEHLLAQPRVGPVGYRSWPGMGPNSRALNGMSHGAAGFAYALAGLAAVADREDFADAARECTAFENSSYDPEQVAWPDFRVTEPHTRSQWCHGAVGIGLSRLAIRNLGASHVDAVDADIGRALARAGRAWPGHVDTLCCGSLGNVEFLRDAGKILHRADLRELASQRLAAVVAAATSSGDYRLGGGARRFNLGLFRGVAGIGYTCLRQTAPSLPNVLIWE